MSGNNTGVVQGDTLSVLSIDILAHDASFVGTINQMSATFSRPNTRIRDIDSSAKGDVKDMVPGVETITLSCTGVALRSTVDKKRMLPNRLAEGIGAGTENRAALFKSLKDNQIPFDIREKQTDPSGRGGYTKVYRGCLFNNFSYSITLQGDVVISESASIDVSSIDEEAF